MNKILLFAFLLCVTFNSFGQCPTNNLFFSSQAQIDAFAIDYPNCTSLANGISIAAASDVTNLQGLSGITSIGGFFTLRNLSNLENLDGLQNLTSINGTFKLQFLSSLNDTSALNGLQYIGGNLEIIELSNLTGLDGLSNLTTIEQNLIFSSNSGLTNLTGLDGLENLNGSFEFMDNSGITDLSALNSITSQVYNIEITGNPSLQDISGFNGINTIENNVLISLNDNLLHVNGFNTLSNIGNDLLIKENELLIDLSGFSSLSNITNSISFEDNNSLIALPDLSNVLVIGGQLNLKNSANLPNLNGLNNISSINGGLYILNCDELNNLTALSNVTYIGGSLSVYGNNNLVDLSALNNLQEIGGSLRIGDTFQDLGNESLELVPFNSLVSIGGDLDIEDNAIINLDGFNMLTTISGSFDIGVHPFLVSINGFNSLTDLSDFFIIDFNSALESIVGFNSLQTVSSDFRISRNYALTSVTGFQNLSTIGGNFKIQDNTLLNSISGFISLSQIDGDFEIGHSLSSGAVGLPNLVSFEGLESLQTVTGDVLINCESIINMNGLNGLSQIGGGLNISGMNHLQTLLGLESLTTIGGDFFIAGNQELENLNGLDGLTEVLGNFTINYNVQLQTLIGLESLVYIEGALDIWINPILESLVGLDSLIETGGLFLNQNPAITNLEGLNSLQTLHAGSIWSQSGPGVLSISFNDILESFAGLESFQSASQFSITQNSSLIDISAISNFDNSTLSGIQIVDNPNLSVCSFLSVCNYFSAGGDGTIINNSAGCNSETEILENCQNLFFELSGNVFFDLDMNGCDADDIVGNNLLITAENNTNQYATTTNDLGEYRVFLGEEGDYNVAIGSSLPNYFEANPTTQIITFDVPSGSAEIDFCIAATEIINDLKISLMPLDEARPGFDSEYLLIYENIGTTLLSGEVSFGFNDEKQQYVNSDQVPFSTSVDEIIWEYDLLLPFQQREITVTLNNFPPPTNNSEDELLITAQVLPIIDDATPIDNNIVLKQIVVNSFDPNDKRVTQGEGILIEEVGDYLNYIVRFQNTGTASAINVRVEDELSENLQWETFRMLSSSHDYIVEITDGNQVSFIFDDIFLPAEQDDEEGSNGYVAFQIRSNDDLVLGDSVENTASIFFDFNEPIITNTVTTTVVEELGILENVLSANIKLFPNPVSNMLNISVSETLSYQKTTIISILGKRLLSSSENTIDLSSLTAGIYFVEISTTEGSITKKIVKE